MAQAITAILSIVVIKIWGPSSETSLLVTETGDNFITETGDFFVTEN